MAYPDGRLHIDVYFPKCGAEMTELEFEREDRKNDVHWSSYRKCPKCGTKIKW